MAGLVQLRVGGAADGRQGGTLPVGCGCARSDVRWGQGSDVQFGAGRHGWRPGHGGRAYVCMHCVRAQPGCVWARLCSIARFGNSCRGRRDRISTMQWIVASGQWPVVSGQELQGRAKTPLYAEDKEFVPPFWDARLKKSWLTLYVQYAILQLNLSTPSIPFPFFKTLGSRFCIQLKAGPLCFDIDRSRGRNDATQIRQTVL